MNIVAIVPIKLNNERCPGKNFRLLRNKPLINYCLESLIAVEEIDSIYVYCSDESICKLLPKGVSFLKRPQHLDLQTSNFTQIFELFYKEVSADIYVYAHATAPFVTVETIRNEITAVSGGCYDSAFCAERIQDFFWSDGKALNFDSSNIPRSQDLPVFYKETSGVYVFQKSVFEKYRSRIGMIPFIAEVGRCEAIDINTSEDFEFAEMMLNYIERRDK